jgi:hypothetical protein
MWLARSSGRPRATDRMECTESLGQGPLDLFRFDECSKKRCHSHSRRDGADPNSMATELDREAFW